MSLDAILTGGKNACMQTVLMDKMWIWIHFRCTKFGDNSPLQPSHNGAHLPRPAARQKIIHTKKQFTPSWDINYWFWVQTESPMEVCLAAHLLISWWRTSERVVPILTINSPSLRNLEMYVGQGPLSSTLKRSENAMFPFRNISILKIKDYCINMFSVG